MTQSLKIEVYTMFTLLNVSRVDDRCLFIVNYTSRHRKTLDSCNYGFLPVRTGFEGLVRGSLPSSKPDHGLVPGSKNLLRNLTQPDFGVSLRNAELNERNPDELPLGGVQVILIDSCYPTQQHQSACSQLAVSRHYNTVIRL